VALVFLEFNIAVYIYGANLPTHPSVLYETYVLIPYGIVSGPFNSFTTIYTSLFLHTEIGHLGGNMLNLWIFGNNIESVVGKLHFTLFYFLCGTIAALGHITTDISFQIPMVGASEAIPITLET